MDFYTVRQGMLVKSPPLKDVDTYSVKAWQERWVLLEHDAVSDSVRLSYFNRRWGDLKKVLTLKAGGRPADGIKWGEKSSKKYEHVWFVKGAIDPKRAPDHERPFFFRSATAIELRDWVQSITAAMGSGNAMLKSAEVDSEDDISDAHISRGGSARGNDHNGAAPPSGWAAFAEKKVELRASRHSAHVRSDDALDGEGEVEQAIVGRANAEYVQFAPGDVKVPSWGAAAVQRPDPADSSSDSDDNYITPETLVARDAASESSPADAAAYVGFSPLSVSGKSKTEYSEIDLAKTRALYKATESAHLHRAHRTARGGENGASDSNGTPRVRLSGQAAVSDVGSAAAEPGFDTGTLKMASRSEQIDNVLDELIDDLELDADFGYAETFPVGGYPVKGATPERAGAAAYENYHPDYQLLTAPFVVGGDNTAEAAGAVDAPATDGPNGDSGYENVGRGGFGLPDNAGVLSQEADGRRASSDTV